MITLNVHDIPPEQYDPIAVPEKHGQTCCWKSVTIGEAELVLFPADCRDRAPEFLPIHLSVHLSVRAATPEQYAQVPTPHRADGRWKWWALGYLDITVFAPEDRLRPVPEPAAERGGAFADFDEECRIATVANRSGDTV